MPAGQRVILEVRWGRLACRKAIIAPGGTVRVGRGDRADIVVAHDGEMSAVHFEVSWDGSTCMLRDLRSAHGTQINGETAASGELHHGSWIRAGNTIFSVSFEGVTAPVDLEAPPEDPALAPARARALAALQAEADPLFAVLDAARDDRILALLRASAETCSSLYTGVQGDALDEVAPYLVELPKGSWLLERLVLEGWGKGWGSYLACARPFKDVRTHLRRFLMVEHEGSAEKLYFRFYDPRVLRVFVPTCSVRQGAQFFGEIRRFLVEGEDLEVLRLDAPASGGAG